MKIGKILNLVFFFIQPIPDLSCKFDQQNLKKNSPKVFKFTWKNCNRLNKKKNQVSDFSDFYFLSYTEKHCNRQFFECRWARTCPDWSPQSKSMRGAGAQPRWGIREDKLNHFQRWTALLRSTVTVFDCLFLGKYIR